MAKVKQRELGGYWCSDCLAQWPLMNGANHTCRTQGVSGIAEGLQALKKHYDSIKKEDLFTPGVLEAYYAEEARFRAIRDNPDLPSLERLIVV